MGEGRPSELEPREHRGPNRDNGLESTRDRRNGKRPDSRGSNRMPIVRLHFSTIAPIGRSSNILLDLPTFHPFSNLFIPNGQ